MILAPFAPKIRRICCCDMAKGAEKGGMEALHFSDKEALLKALQKRLRPGCVVWFKGSRGMHMETLIEALYEG